MSAPVPCNTCGSPVRIKQKRIREPSMSESRSSFSVHEERECTNRKCGTNLYPRERTQGDV